MSRGDRREDIFLDDVDRQDFIKTLAEACQKTGWQLHAAYCLMRNYFHLGAETPEPNPVEGMRGLLPAPSPARVLSDKIAWGTVVASGLIIGGTILADVLTAGLSVADDSATIIAGIILIGLRMSGGSKEH